ncbi:MAG: histidine kinase dimerization/phosphoacceptor domain -containing protein [Methanobacterium sp.]
MGLLTVVIFALTLIIFGNYGYNTYLSNIFTTIIDLVAVLLLFSAAIVSKTYGRKIYLGWLFLAFAQLFYFIGDSLFGLFQMGLFLSNTYPAELFYIFYYILLIVSLLFLSKEILSIRDQLKFFIDIVIVLSSTALLVLIFFILPFVETINTVSINFILSLNYIFLDFFIFMVFISLFMLYEKIRTPLFLLSVGILFISITDFIYAFYNINGSYVSGSMMDIGWVIGYLFMGLAAVSQIVNDEIDFKKYLPKFNFLHKFTWNIYIPLILVFIAYICNVWAYKNITSQYLYLLDYIVGAIVFLVIIRQIITLKENQTLYIEASEEITKREKVENELQKSEKKYREIVENASEGIISTDSDGLLTFYNDRFTKMLGYKENELKGRNILSLMDDESKEIAQSCMVEAKKGKKGQNEIKLIKKDGSILNVLTNVSPIIYDDQYHGCLAMMSDITEIKGAQQQISDSLIEKEILLREIHHRVKNNMQIISSMLSLQSNYIEDEEMQEIFAESRNRVKTMALVHEKLYKSQDIAKIDIKDYVEDIITFMVSSYVLDESTLDFNIYSEDISFNMDTAVPLCLIINELLTNSIKYAFPGGTNFTGKENKITIKITPVDDGYELLIMDNGIGLGEDFDLNKVNSLGLNIVNALVKQLKGSIDLLETRGTTFKIFFKEKNGNDQIN